MLDPPPTGCLERVLAAAPEEAVALREGWVSTEHLLLALLREPICCAARIGDQQGITFGRIREALHREPVRSDHQPDIGAVLLTPRAERVLALAAEEARATGGHRTRTDHLILGLMVEGEGLAARVLDQVGLSAAQARLDSRGWRLVNADEE